MASETRLPDRKIKVENWPNLRDIGGACNVSLVIAFCYSQRTRAPVDCSDGAPPVVDGVGQAPERYTYLSCQ